jgi:hypothetical protein
MALIPQLSIYGDMICTGTDLSKFVDHGTTTDANGNAYWFRFSSHGIDSWSWRRVPDTEGSQSNMLSEVGTGEFCSAERIRW